MSEDKYPSDPVCSKVRLRHAIWKIASHLSLIQCIGSHSCKSQCQATKTQADFSLSQLKKHAKRVCTACVAVGVSELVAFRNSHLAKEVASYTAADKVDDALAAAMRRREAKRNASRQGRVHFQMRTLQSMIASCCQHLEAWLPQLVHNTGDETVATASPALPLQNSEPVSTPAFSETMLDMQRFYSPYPSSVPLRSDSRAFTLQWAALPQSVDPSRSGGLTPARAERKRQQVEFVLSYLLTVVAPGAVIVDVGSASGNFSLPLAAALPQCTFVLIDWSDSHLQLAAARAAAAGLGNVRTHLGGYVNSIDKDLFSIALHLTFALHVCSRLWWQNPKPARIVPL